MDIYGNVNKEQYTLKINENEVKYLFHTNSSDITDMLSNPSEHNELQDFMDFVKLIVSRLIFHATSREISNIHYMMIGAYEKGGLSLTINNQRETLDTLIQRNVSVEELMNKEILEFLEFLKDNIMPTIEGYVEGEEEVETINPPVERVNEYSDEQILKILFNTVSEIIDFAKLISHDTINSVSSILYKCKDGLCLELTGKDTRKLSEIYFIAIEYGYNPTNKLYENKEEYKTRNILKELSRI